MENNYEKLIDYAIAKGYTITHDIQEIGSGVNDNRQKLTKLLKDVIVEMAVMASSFKLMEIGDT